MKLLSNITYLFEILPLLFCLLFYKKINTKPLKVFFIYTFFVSFCIGGVAYDVDDVLKMYSRMLNTVNNCDFFVFLLEWKRDKAMSVRAHMKQFLVELEADATKKLRISDAWNFLLLAKGVSWPPTF